MSLRFIQDRSAFHRTSAIGRLLAGGIQLPVIAVLLGGVGVLALYSVVGGSMEPYATSHLVRLLAGIGLLLLSALLPARFWLLASVPLYVLSLMALAAVPVLGVTISGAQRWLDLGILTLQPAELMKLSLVLVLAYSYQRLPPHVVSRPLAVLLALTLTLVPAVLVLEQPDLGTAMLIGACGLTLMFAAGVNGLYFVAGALTVGILAPVIWSGLHDYQRERILVFLDPERDLLGAGYQVFQSRIALAAGGLSGKGFLQGTQTQLDFVPENHTDFVLSLIGEEHGFIGTAGVLGLFAALMLTLILSIWRTRGRFQRLVVTGVSVLFFLHVSVNVAMVMGLLPVVGVPLPLISFGGSSLLTALAALGVAMSMQADGAADLAPNRRASWRLSRG
ncbi:MAG: rod shape-determining protein RodA [Hyphomicrobiaceae bacterium]